MAVIMTSDVAKLRRVWGLSQKQFAELFMTSMRTVRRWEAGEYKPDAREQMFLRAFSSYARAHGVIAFRRRFVRQAPRYGRRGRPAA